MKYKHKITGVVGTTDERDQFLHFERCIIGKICAQESLSMDFVRGSSDWIEVKEPEKEYYFNDLNELVITATGEVFKDGDRVYGKTKQGNIVSGIFEGFSTHILHFHSECIEDLTGTLNSIITTTPTENMVMVSGQQVAVSTLRKSEVLFTTDDGYDIYTKDTFYLVTDNTFNIHKQEAPAFTKKLDQHKRFKEYKNAMSHACYCKNIFSIDVLDKLLGLSSKEVNRLLRDAESKIELKNF